MNKPIIISSLSLAVLLIIISLFSGSSEKKAISIPIAVGETEIVYENTEIQVIDNGESWKGGVVARIDGNIIWDIGGDENTNDGLETGNISDNSSQGNFGKILGMVVKNLTDSDLNSNNIRIDDPIAQKLFADNVSESSSNQSTRTSSGNQSGVQVGDPALFIYHTDGSGNDTIVTIVDPDSGEIINTLTGDGSTNNDPTSSTIDEIAPIADPDACAEGNKTYLYRENGSVMAIDMSCVGR